MANKTAAGEAVSKLNGTDFMGRSLKVEIVSASV